MHEYHLNQKTDWPYICDVISKSGDVICSYKAPGNGSIYLPLKYHELIEKNEYSFRIKKSPYKVEC